MPKKAQPEQTWELPEKIYEGEYWSITDFRMLESIQVISDDGYAFTLPYENWDEFAQTVRMTETQTSVEGDMFVAQQMEDEEGHEHWYFNVLMPEHMLSFYLDEERLQLLREAVAEAEDYPWSEVVYQVDEREMQRKVAEQRRWLANRRRGVGRI